MRSIVEKTKNHFVLVRVQGDYLNNFIFKLSKMNITIKKINYLNNNKIEILIKKDRYKELKKRYPGYKFKIIKDVGFYKVRPFIRRHRYFLFSIFIGLIALYCLSRVILKVDVIHSNKNIRNLVKTELSEVGIKKYSLKKSYKKINKIKENILDKYPDKIEWLEIENIGMTYTVYIEERIIKEKEEKMNEYCHVVADKSAIITKIISSKGEKVKVVDNYVNEGDIIISGEIKLYEDVRDNVCAEGKVYGEVWYTVNVKVPLEYEEKIYTGEIRKNIRYETDSKKHSIFRSKFKKYDIEDKKKLITLFNVDFVLEEELEYNSKIKRHTEKEAINHGIDLAKEKIEIKLKKDERVLKEKVLKKVLNNSTIELEIFIAVEESIGILQSYEINISEEMS